MPAALLAGWQRLQLLRRMNPQRMRRLPQLLHSAAGHQHYDDVCQRHKQRALLSLMINSSASSAKTASSMDIPVGPMTAGVISCTSSGREMVSAPLSEEQPELSEPNGCRKPGCWLQSA